MKLIINIPEDVYAECQGDIYFPDMGGELFNAVKNGIPLDDVKAELERANRMYPYTNHGILEAIAIIDKHIGKAESEGQMN